MFAELAPTPRARFWIVPGSMHRSVLVLLQLAATATGYHLPQLVHTSCHLHAARARRGHPVLSSPEEKQGRSPLDKMGGAFKGGIEDAVKRVTGDYQRMSPSRVRFVTLTHPHKCSVCHPHRQRRVPVRRFYQVSSRGNQGWCRGCSQESYWQRRVPM